MTDRPRSAGSRASVLDALDRVGGQGFPSRADAATLRELREVLAAWATDAECLTWNLAAGPFDEDDRPASAPVAHCDCNACALAALLSAGAEGEP